MATHAEPLVNAMRAKNAFWQRHRERLVAASLTAMLAACHVAERPATEFNPHASADSATRTLHAMNPVGMPLDIARRNMDQTGFECRPAGNTAQGYRISLLCTLSQTRPAPQLATPLASAFWAVTLDSSDGQTLARLVVNRQPGDLLP